MFELVQKTKQLAGSRIVRGLIFSTGDLTIADVLVFTALVRFDSVYAPLFRIGGKRLSDFAALTAFVRRVYDIPGIAETVRFDYILAHYFDSDWSIPPRRGIVPNLTEMSWRGPPSAETAVGLLLAQSAL
jgi:putative glutathione S-transferase